MLSFKGTILIREEKNWLEESWTGKMGCELQLTSAVSVRIARVRRLRSRSVVLFAGSAPTGFHTPQACQELKTPNSQFICYRRIRSSKEQECHDSERDRTPSYISGGTASASRYWSNMRILTSMQFGQLGSFRTGRCLPHSSTGKSRTALPAKFQCPGDCYELQCYLKGKLHQLPDLSLDLADTL